MDDDGEVPVQQRPFLVYGGRKNRERKQLNHDATGGAAGEIVKAVGSVVYDRQNLQHNRGSDRNPGLVARRPALARVRMQVRRATRMPVRLPSAGSWARYSSSMDEVTTGSGHGRTRREQARCRRQSLKREFGIIRRQGWRWLLNRAAAGGSQSPAPKRNPSSGDSTATTVVRGRCGNRRYGWWAEASNKTGRSS